MLSPGLQGFSPINEMEVSVNPIPLVAKVAFDLRHNYWDLFIAPL